MNSVERNISGYEESMEEFMEEHTCHEMRERERMCDSKYIISDIVVIQRRRGCKEKTK